MEGVDLSSAMIAEAAGKAVYDTLHTAELCEHLAAETRRFDLVTAADVLIYLGDLAPLLHAAGARLADAGLLALTVEAAEPEGPGVERRLRPSRRFAHSADYVQRVAAEAGLALRHHERGVIRRDRADDVDGHVMVFERRAGEASSELAVEAATRPPGPRRRRRRRADGS